MSQSNPHLPSLVKQPSRGHDPGPSAMHLPPTLTHLRSLLRYGVAFLSVILAVLVREVLTPLWGSKLPFLTLYPAVLLSTWYGGLGPGLITTALCTVAAAYLWLAPVHTWVISDIADQVGLALAVLVMLLITWLTAALRRTQEQLQQQVSQVQTHVAALQESQTALALHTRELEQVNHALREEVAARQRAEQHLRERVEEWETLFDLLPVSVWQMHDSAGTHITGNRAGYEMIRMPAGTNTSLSAPPSARPAHYKMFWLDGREVPPEELPMQYAIAHGATVPNTEFLYRFDDGAEMYADGTAKPLFDAQGHVRGSLGVFIDITERKRAEEALAQHAAQLERLNSGLLTEVAARQQAEQHLRERVEELETLLDILPVAVWIGHDPASTHITGNRASYELLRMPPGSNISASAPPAERPTHFTIYGADGTELRPADLPMQYAGAHGVVVSGAEYCYRFTDGTETYAYGTAKPLFDAHDQVRGSVAVFLDITARKQAEEALAQHARDLERAHADLRQVAYVSAHDLQEPVRQLGLYSQRIALRYRESADVETQEALAFIVEGSKRMQAQCTDLMHYLEIEEPDAGMTRTDCEYLFRRTLDTLHEPIAASGAIITHDALPTLTVNAKQLQLVLQELLDNAVKFRNSVSPRVHVWAEHEGDAWRFAVRDHGIGIAPQSVGRLFGFFRKLHQRQHYPGTGMGLAICKKIVERHGGRIWIDSQPEEGTTVYFTIREKSSQQPA